MFKTGKEKKMLFVKITHHDTPYMHFDWVCIKKMKLNKFYKKKRGNVSLRCVCVCVYVTQIHKWCGKLQTKIQEKLKVNLFSLLYLIFVLQKETKK